VTLTSQTLKSKGVINCQRPMLLKKFEGQWVVELLVGDYFWHKRSIWPCPLSLQPHNQKGSLTAQDQCSYEVLGLWAHAFLSCWSETMLGEPIGRITKRHHTAKQYVPTLFLKRGKTEGDHNSSLWACELKWFAQRY
jgi:hypothetical protein